MAITTKGSITAANLQEWLMRKTLEVFEPNLFFHSMGEKPSFPSGYNTLRWSKFDRIANASVIDITEGTTPTAVAFDASTVSVTPNQLGVTVTISDLLLGDSVLDWLGGAADAVGRALARRVDDEIQQVVQAGTNVIYGGDATSRVTIDSADTLTADDLNKVRAFLDAKAAPTFGGGMYVIIVHSNQAYDLRAETATGSWLDAHKYEMPENIFNGEIGALSGVRVVVTPFLKTNTGGASSETVYPAIALGRGAYGVPEFDSLRTFLTPAVPSDSDPLVQRRTVGAKINFGSVILQQDAMLRVETASSLDAATFVFTE